jgi:serine/threonine protein kinase
MNIPYPKSPDELPANNPPMALNFCHPVSVLHGGMSLVYLCETDAATWGDRRQVAVKRLNPQVNAIPGAPKRFLRECYLWLQLGSHRNIVEALSASQGELKAPLLVLEYVPRSLRRLMMSGQFALDTILPILIGICEGLTYAGEILPGFVHADLKPENVLLAPDGTAKMTDLGLSRVLERDPSAVNASGEKSDRYNTSSPIGGTPLYMAPEQIRNQELCSATDVYAIGCIAYELVTGKPTYGVPTSISDYLKRHMYAKPVPIKPKDLSTPKALIKIIDAMLKKSPSERPSLTELTRLLRALASDEHVAVPEPPIGRVSSESRMNAAYGLLNLGLIEEGRRAAQMAIENGRHK